MRHFSSFIDTLPTDFRFQGSTSFIAAEALPGRSEGISVKLHDDAQGKLYDVDAAAVIDARCRQHATVRLCCHRRALWVHTLFWFTGASTIRAT